jgi:hypothetical protein
VSILDTAASGSVERSDLDYALFLTMLGEEMGSMYGVKLNYNPFWEEHLENMSEKEQLYHQGYDDGYSVGAKYHDKLENLKQENDALRALCAANVRVIKEELKKELVNEKEETNDQTQELASSIRPGGTILPGSTRV